MVSSKTKNPFAGKGSYLAKKYDNYDPFRDK
jgi:hypothetical protein